MGHRNMFSSSQLFENENDQGWNHGEQPYMHLGISTFFSYFVHFLPLKSLANNALCRSLAPSWCSMVILVFNIGFSPMLTMKICIVCYSGSCGHSFNGMDFFLL